MLSEYILSPQAFNSLRGIFYRVLIFSRTLFPCCFSFFPLFFPFLPLFFPFSPLFPVFSLFSPFAYTLPIFSHFLLFSLFFPLLKIPEFFPPNFSPIFGAPEFPKSRNDFLFSFDDNYRSIYSKWV